LPSASRIATVPLTVTPEYFGALMVPVTSKPSGGTWANALGPVIVIDGAATVTFTGGDMPGTPWSSVAIAVIWYLPAAGLVHVVVYGALVAVPSSVVP
jgi:hypothetical protein